MDISDHIYIRPEDDFDVRALPTHVDMEKKECKEILKANTKVLDELQQQLFSSKKHSVLLVFQAMDAAGKDSTIRAVFSGMNPAGFRVSNFKQPSSLELAHDFMWRVNAALPKRGNIGIFNRSHYEEVLVTRVHPEYILRQNIPYIETVSDVNEAFWTRRLNYIASYEQHLSDQGYLILKFFLNVSREEQKERFLSRMDNEHKHWKFSLGDMRERALWDDYMHAYNEMIRHTSKACAPWYVIPADDKDYLRASVSSHVREALESIGLSYPEADEDVSEDITEARRLFAQEEANELNTDK